MNNKNITLIIAATMTALVAGLFFGFVVAINPAFSRLPDVQYITAMQAINDAIQNPVFAFTFFGPALFLPLAAFAEGGRPLSRRAILLLVAAVVYVLGGLGVTFLANVPMNDTLAGFSVKAGSIEQAAQLRLNYAEAWNNWHNIRTIATIVSLILIIIACLSTTVKRVVGK